MVTHAFRRLLDEVARDRCWERAMLDWLAVEREIGAISDREAVLTLVAGGPRRVRER